MKKTIFLCFIATLFIAGINSCSKTSSTDLTANIVGVYTGVAVDSFIGSSSNTENLTATVTKVDDSHVLITPSDTTVIPSVVQVVVSSNGDLLNVVSGIYKGVAYVPYYVTVNSSTASGYYTPSNRQLGYAIQFTSGGSNIIQTFNGSH